MWEVTTRVAAQPQEPHRTNGWHAAARRGVHGRVTEPQRRPHEKKGSQERADRGRGRSSAASALAVETRSTVAVAAGGSALSMRARLGGAAGGGETSGVAAPLEKAESCGVASVVLSHRDLPWSALGLSGARERPAACDAPTRSTAHADSRRGCRRPDWSPCR